jgi:hypothetical protein
LGSIETEFEPIPIFKTGIEDSNWKHSFEEPDPVTGFPVLLMCENV